MRGVGSRRGEGEGDGERLTCKGCLAHSLGLTLGHGTRSIRFSVQESLLSRSSQVSPKAALSCSCAVTHQPHSPQLKMRAQLPTMPTNKQHQKPAPAPDRCSTLMEVKEGGLPAKSSLLLTGVRPAAGQEPAPCDRPARWLSCSRISCSMKQAMP